MPTSRFSVPALVYDGPLPPFQNMGELYVLPNTTLIRPSVGDPVNEAVGTKVLRTAPFAKQAELHSWLVDQGVVQDGTQISPTDTEAVESLNQKWWSVEEPTFVSARDELAFHEVGVYEKVAGEMSPDYFRIGNDLVYAQGLEFVPSTEEGDGDSDRVLVGECSRQQFTLLNTTGTVSVRSEDWTELVEQGEVYEIRPIVDSLTGLRTHTREQGFRFTL